MATGAEAAAAAAQEQTLAWPAELGLASYVNVEDLLQIPASSHQFVVQVEGITGNVMAVKDGRQMAMRDYYSAIFSFSQEVGLSNQQASALCHLMHRMLNKLQTEQAPLSQNVEWFKSVMTTNASFDTELTADGKKWDFPKSCVSEVTAFVNRTLFQHYKMYAFLLHGDRPEMQTVLPLQVPVPPAVPALHEAVSHADVETRKVADLATAAAAEAAAKAESDGADIADSAN